MSRPQPSTIVAGLLLTVAIGFFFVAPAGADAARSTADQHAVATGTTPAVAGPSFAATNTTDIDPDAVVMAVSVEPNGSARWAVSYRLRLAGQNETAAFEDLQADIASNESAYTARFARRMNRTAADAEEFTGRSMSVGPVTITTSREPLPQEYGIVTYRFRWSGFARVEGDHLVAGDAISGLFLDEQTTLRIGWPDDYRARSIAPEPEERRSGAAIWRGQTEFTAEQPRVTIAPAEPTTTSPTDTAAPGGPGEGGDGNLWLFGGLLLLVLAVLAWFGYRRRDAGTAGGVGGAEDAGDDGGASAAGSGSPTDPDLLSNEERVLQLLEANGGRMKQQDIADKLEWTDAKTSQVIGGLREEDDLETFRLGRENVVTLPDAGGPIE